MLTIHVWPKWLKEFLLTHPLYKSPYQIVAQNTIKCWRKVRIASGAKSYPMGTDPVSMGNPEGTGPDIFGGNGAAKASRLPPAHRVELDLHRLCGDGYEKWGCRRGFTGQQGRRAKRTENRRSQRGEFNCGPAGSLRPGNPTPMARAYLLRPQSRRFCNCLLQLHWRICDL